MPRTICSRCDGRRAWMNVGHLDPGAAGSRVARVDLPGAGDAEDLDSSGPAARAGRSPADRSMERSASKALPDRWSVLPNARADAS